VPSNVVNVPGNACSLSTSEGTGTGRQRSERLRARRSEAGLAQVSGWVPRERRAYAREVLAALAQGVNSLPPDPEQVAELDAARTALAEAEKCGRALEAELDTVRTEVEAARDAGRRAEAAALARAETAEAEAVAAQERAETLRQKLEGIMSNRGWRGLLLHLAVRTKP